MSRSEGDLRETDDFAVNEGPVSPSYYYRSHSDSDDSGVRVSMASDDSSLVLKCKVNIFIIAGIYMMVGIIR